MGTRRLDESTVGRTCLGAVTRSEPLYEADDLGIEEVSIKVDGADMITVVQYQHASVTARDAITNEGGVARRHDVVVARLDDQRRLLNQRESSCRLAHQRQNLRYGAGPDATVGDVMFPGALVFD